MYPHNTSGVLWMEVDSNHRSNLQQIYSLSPLATRESIQTHCYLYHICCKIASFSFVKAANDRYTVFRYNTMADVPGSSISISPVSTG